MQVTMTLEGILWAIAAALLARINVVVNNAAAARRFGKGTRTPRFSGDSSLVWRFFFCVFEKVVFSFYFLLWGRCIVTLGPPAVPFLTPFLVGRVPI